MLDGKAERMERKPDLEGEATVAAMMSKSASTSQTAAKGAASKPKWVPKTFVATSSPEHPLESVMASIEKRNQRARR